MEPGEIEPPPFAFTFQPNSVLNWRQIINEVNINDLLQGINLESLEVTHLNFAFADIVADPSFISTEDPDALKVITLF